MDLFFSIVNSWSRMVRDLKLRALLFVLFSVGLNLPLGQAIWINLPSSGTKCVSEEIQTNVVVLTDYTVVPDDSTYEIPTISAKVPQYLNWVFLLFVNWVCFAFALFVFFVSDVGFLCTCIDFEENSTGVRWYQSIDWLDGFWYWLQISHSSAPFVGYPNR